MSALPPKADIHPTLFNHLIGERFTRFSIVLRVRGVRAALALSLKFDGALAMLLALCSSAASVA
jgi:hypothetical protein